MNTKIHYGRDIPPTNSRTSSWQSRRLKSICLVLCREIEMDAVHLNFMQHGLNAVTTKPKVQEYGHLAGTIGTMPASRLLVKNSYLPGLQVNLVHVWSVTHGNAPFALQASLAKLYRGSSRNRFSVPVKPEAFSALSTMSVISHGSSNSMYAPSRVSCNSM